MNRKQIKEIQELIKDQENREIIQDKEKFTQWKLRWYDEVPKCRDFVCCHELMSCGIHALCGDCTIYDTWKNKFKNSYICLTVDCMDCDKKYTCKKLKFRDCPMLNKIKLTDDDKEFVERIRSSKPVHDNVFDEFWIKHGELCSLFGFNKESYREAMRNSKLSKKRCENCALFQEERCSIIEFAFKDHKHVALFWIYTGNSCSGFEKGNIANDYLAIA